MRKTALALSALILAACGDKGVPTSEEGRQLDEAANMLNEAPANLDAIDDSELANAPAAENRL